MGSIELKSVEKWYGSAQVIKGIDLSINEGEFVVFVGPSGCGKSTLLRMIGGLEDISRGTLEINGEDVTAHPPAKRGLAMVFQSYALYPHMSVRDNMAFGLKTAGAPKAEIAEKVDYAAKTLQLEPYLERRPKDLSGGQRQRVAIGRSIVRDPTAFLFDEPLSNLDAALRVEMRHEIAKLHQSLKSTMIYVTHDQVEAMTMADRIVVLDAGFIAQVGTPLELYHKPDNLFVAGFIGNPKMNFIEVECTGTTKSGIKVKVADAGEITVPVAPRGDIKGKTLTLGIRPEHTRLTKSDLTLNLHANVVERLGIHTVTYANLPNDDEVFCTVQEGTAPIEANSEFSIGINAIDCHLFDEEGVAFERDIDLSNLGLPEVA